MSAAVEALRQAGRPYPLAEGLLDFATGLARVGDRDRPAALLTEAREIADGLRAAPLAARIRAAQESGDARVSTTSLGETAP